LVRVLRVCRSGPGHSKAKARAGSQRTAIEAIPTMREAAPVLEATGELATSRWNRESWPRAGRDRWALQRPRNPPLQTYREAGPELVRSERAGSRGLSVGCRVRRGIGGVLRSGRPRRRIEHDLRSGTRAPSVSNVAVVASGHAVCGWVGDCSSRSLPRGSRQDQPRDRSRFRNEHPQGHILMNWRKLLWLLVLFVVCGGK
jgi:hypothetical protein